VAAATSVGLVRKRNEDSAYVGRWLCAVADGMGGHAAGDIASATVIEAIRSFDVQADGPSRLTTILGAAVRSANKQLTAKVKADPQLGNMGSTLTALLCSGGHVAVANIGDSRAYLLRNAVLRPLTEDHVLSNLVANPMPPGIGSYLVRFLDARPGWSPDLTLRTAQPGDRYLICSDGLSGFVTEDAIQQVLANEREVDQAVAELVDLAHAAGAPDNVTVVAMDVPDGIWQERDEDPLILGAAASLVAGLAIRGVGVFLGPRPGGRLVPLQGLDGLDPVAWDHVLRDFDRFIVNGGAAHADDHHHRDGHGDLKLRRFRLARHPGPEILHP
jgi:serine/threonine protein phosphatase PrpC